MRKPFLLLHRYVGLALAAFLVIIGLTGSIIIFFEDLDEWANPDLRLVTPSGHHKDFLELREKFQKDEPQAHFYAIRFPEHVNDAMYFYTEPAIDPVTGEELSIDHDQVYANPYTGERLGQRMWGDFSLERKDWFTFLYFLHYSLVLPETFGEIFMGIVALVWAFDCFVGLYLTFPSSTNIGASFWQRWKQAWKVKTTAGSNRLVYDWHRASGLWIWPVLLLFAWSGFSFNMPRVYTAVMSQITNIENNDALPKLDTFMTNPAIDWRQALALGEKYMAEQAKEQGFTINRPSMLLYRRETGIYDYRVNSSRDVRTRQDYGYTSVAIDAMTGELRQVQVPTGQLAGNTFTTWIKSLHTAAIFGWPLKIFNCIVGLLVVALTITGVWLWLRKRVHRIAKQAAVETQPNAA